MNTVEYFLKALLAYLALCLQISSSSKILLTAPQMSSHVFQQIEMGTALVERGHEVYMAVGSRYPNREQLEKLGMKVILFRIPDDIMYGVSKEFEMFISENIFKRSIDVVHTSIMVNRDCTFMMEDEKFLDEVRKIGFDLAIVEAFVLSPCTLLLPKYLQIPFVSLSTGFLPWKSRVPALPSFYPVPNPYRRLDETTLLGRFENLVAYVLLEIGFLLPGVQNTTLLQRYAPELSCWSELVREAQLYLVPTDHYMGPMLPSFPNIVTIAGLTCSPSKTLEPNLEDIMTENKHGVIILSFGSMAYYMPKDVIIKLLEAFKQLEETVVARLPHPEGVTVPRNVKLLSWLPQNDILGHPNTKLFITHCGSNGQHESLYHGVPMIGFPLFAEQHMNSRLMQDKGFGLTMDIHEFNSDDLYRNIKEVLNNPKYRSNIKKASERFRDQPMSSQEKAVLWIDHVIKYGGSHLRSPSMDQPLYQFLMLDILVVLLLFLVVLLIIAKIIFRVIFKRLFSRKECMIKMKAQ